MPPTSPPVLAHAITPAMALKARQALQEAANAALIAYYSDMAPFQQGWHLNQLAVEFQNAARFLGYTITPITQPGSGEGLDPAAPPTREAHHVAATTPDKLEPSGAPSLNDGCPDLSELLQTQNR